MSELDLGGSVARKKGSWLWECLVCPVDGRELAREGNWLVSEAGRRYPVVDEIPVFLRDDVPGTAWWLRDSLDRARRVASGEEAPPRRDWPEGEVHPHVQGIVDSTCGYLYRTARGRLKDYPVPPLRLKGAPGETLLDVGCNWGRWTFAAARQGLRPVGIDPSLGSVLAARDIASRLNLDCSFVVGDARYLPFAKACFDRVFSYSVLQHFSKPDALLGFREAERILKKGGTTLIQLPNRFGVRSAFHLAKRGFREGEKFDVRYYRPAEIRGIFETVFGNAKLSVDGYFGLGIQPSDLAILSPFGKTVVRSSEFLRTLQKKVPCLLQVADSLYVESVKEG